MFIVQMAAKLCTEAGSEAPAVEAKREEIGAKYAALQQDIQVTLFCKKKLTTFLSHHFEEVLLLIQTGLQGKTLRGRCNARIPT